MYDSFLIIAKVPLIYEHSKISVNNAKQAGGDVKFIQAAKLFECIEYEGNMLYQSVLEYYPGTLTSSGDLDRSIEVAKRMATSKPDNWGGHLMHAQRLQNSDRHQEMFAVRAKSLLKKLPARNRPSAQQTHWTRSTALPVI